MVFLSWPISQGEGKKTKLGNIFRGGDPADVHTCLRTTRNSEGAGGRREDSSRGRSGRCVGDRRDRLRASHQTGSVPSRSAPSHVLVFVELCLANRHVGSVFLVCIMHHCNAVLCVTALYCALGPCVASRPHLVRCDAMQLLSHQTVMRTLLLPKPGLYS